MMRDDMPVKQGSPVGLSTTLCNCTEQRTCNGQ